MSLLKSHTYGIEVADRPNESLSGGRTAAAKRPIRNCMSMYSKRPRELTEKEREAKPNRPPSRGLVVPKACMMDFKNRKVDAEAFFELGEHVATGKTLLEVGLDSR